MSKILKFPRIKALRLIDDLKKELHFKFVQTIDAEREIEKVKKDRDRWLARANKQLASISSDDDFSLPLNDIILSIGSDIFYTYPSTTIERFNEETKGIITQIDDYRERVSDADEYIYLGTGKVFIIHGHGDRNPLEQAIIDLGLEPVVLIEEAGGSKTVIEKLEQYARNVDYAVAIFTPDDRGSRRSVEELHDRARQNVVLETGFFLSALGRANVCILKAEAVSLTDLSDLHGIITIAYGKDTNWQDDLKKELEHANVI